MVTHRLWLPWNRLSGLWQTRRLALLVGLALAALLAVFGVAAYAQVGGRCANVPVSINAFIDLGACVSEGQDPAIKIVGFQPFEEFELLVTAPDGSAVGQRGAVNAAGSLEGIRLPVGFVSAGLWRATFVGAKGSFADAYIMVVGQPTQSILVPNVIGLDANVARSQLAALNMPANITFRTARCAPYTVIETFPPTGQPLAPDTQPLLTICEPLLMPNLVGLTREQAQNELNALGVPWVISETADNRLPDDTVWATFPTPDQPLPVGDQLATIFVIDKSKDVQPLPEVTDPIEPVVPVVPIDPGAYPAP